MKPRLTGWLAASALLLALALPGLAQFANLDIPYKKHILPNGLTLIVHEDHKAPIVAVNVWYHVGSKNEKQGKTGFAHLFEHLMFNGSEHANDDYFQVLERIGATDLNGTTNEDRTNYFQNVPTSALDTVLWLESDRMGHLLGVIDKGKLDEQRGVVQNEKRQSENQPYGIAYELLTVNSFPEGHPYSWTVIGSMEDLNAASLDDVKEWFKDYYGAANATIVLAGDIDFETAKAKVEKYFGDIPAGPPVARHQRWIAKRTGTKRQTAQDRVPQARVYMAWNIPPDGDPATDYLNLLSDVLSQGKTSRLYKRLVYDDQIATDVRASVYTSEIASGFIIESTARPGVELSRVETAIREELDRLLKEGPTQNELNRVRTQYFASFVRGIERIGGFGGKSDILASNQVYHGSPDAYKESLRRVENATVKDLHAAGVEWLSDGVYILEIQPYPNYKTLSSSAGRDKMPEPGEPPELKLPKLERTTLKNGLKVVLAQRHEIPVVNMRLLVDAGYAADQTSKPGTAKLAMNMLDEGAGSLDALQISEKLANLGATLSSGSNLDMSVVSLSALKPNLGASIELMADVVLNPAFPKKEFDRLVQEQLALIDREKAQPIQMALRVLPAKLYSDSHAYGMPLTGSGTAASVKAIQLADLKKFHNTWFKPNHSTLIVVGDTTLGEITPLLEKALGSWKQGEIPKKNITEVAQQQKPRIFLIDKPGALQSIVIAGHVAPPKANPQEIPIETLNAALGGMFISRINMNLREDKHWSYGATSMFVDARGQRPFFVYAPVQTDKTGESMAEIQRELTEVLEDRPISEDELKKAQENLTLSLPGSRETQNRVAASIEEIVRFDLPDDYFETYPDKVRSLTTGQLKDAGVTALHPDKLTWIVVGDREKIEQGVKDLGFGDVILINPDGDPL